MRIPATSALRTAGVISFALLAMRLYPLSQIRSDPDWSPRLLLTVVDAETRKPLAARFSLTVDGQEHEPRWVGAHGLRLVSVHVSRKQTYVVTYARGTGTVEVPLTSGVKQLEVSVARGFQYLPATVKLEVSGDPLEAEIPLRRWSTLAGEGWRAADTHLHYDRVEPAGDRDWFHAMDGDGLTHAQFMVLKGGMVPGIWSRQFAYGRQGEGADGERLIVPGEEYRDRLQGHILLFGLGDVIQPIMAGTSESPNNYPIFHDVLRRARASGGIVGAAHGATLGRSPTGIADAILGALDFWEIGNAHLWKLDLWYRLMNCGYLLPPIAGTDLPNNPYRDRWQPFLGSIRTFVKLDGGRGSGAWNEAVKQGRLFVSSGPLIRFSVNGAGPGETVRLPAGGGEVQIDAELIGPRELRSLEILRNGRPEDLRPREAPGPLEPVRKLVVRRKIVIKESSWLAARGVGSRIEALGRDAVAHTAAVRVLVGGRPIQSAEDAAFLIDRLTGQREFHAQNGVYARPAHKDRALAFFDQAIEAMRVNQN